MVLYKFAQLCCSLQPECNPETCTQMTATEQWIFLCAAHKTPKEVSWQTASCIKGKMFSTLW